MWYSFNKSILLKWLKMGVKNKMSIGKRLEELIIYRGTNVNKVARAANISPQTIYGIIKRDNTKVDINILMALARQLDVTLDFFSGGEMSPERIEDETLLSKYRDLDEHGRRVVHAIMDLELERVEKAVGQAEGLPEEDPA
jgi:transcriptional regulator with XRE-family HTH domain